MGDDELDEYGEISLVADDVVTVYESGLDGELETICIVE